MENKRITRKQFLVSVFCGLGAAFFNRFSSLTRIFEQKPHGKLKEARFYKKADHLAG